jgi:hypothetical protein
MCRFDDMGGRVMKTYSFREAHESGKRYRVIGSLEKKYYRYNNITALAVSAALADYELEPDVVEFETKVCDGETVGYIREDRLNKFIGKHIRVRVEVIE